MIKLGRVFLFLLFSLVYAKISFCQIIGLQKEIDRFPVEASNRQFIDFINKEFETFLKQKPDTLLLFHIAHTGYGTRDYALIFSKKETLSKIFVIDHFKVIEVNDDTLKSINVKGLYQILENDYVRTIDTNIFIAHNDVVCCQFYFGNKKKLLIGYLGRVFHMLDSLDPRLIDAYIRTSDRY